MKVEDFHAIDTVVRDNCAGTVTVFQLSCTDVAQNRREGAVVSSGSEKVMAIFSAVLAAAFLRMGFSSVFEMPTAPPIEKSTERGLDAVATSNANCESPRPVERGHRGGMNAVPGNRSPAGSFPKP